MENKADIDYFNNQIASPVNNENEVLDQQKELELIYTSLLNKKFKENKWIELFSQFSDKHERILYSILSGMILKESNEAKMNLLELNLNIINSKITNQQTKTPNLLCVSEKTYKLYYKFFDHCSLAIAQRRIYNQSDEMSKARTELIVKKQMKKEIENRVMEYEKNITGQLIGLISIFTALSFVIFGGINVLGSLVENAKTTDLIKFLFIADIWFLSMFNVLFVFVKFIAAITKRKVKKLWIYFIIINIVLIAFMFILRFAFNMSF